VKLRWRLSKGKAIRQFKIEWDEKSAGFWPSHIQQLDGLEEFAFICTSSAPKHHLSAANLTILSRNLKCLLLSAHSALDALSKLFSKDPGHFPHLELLWIGFYSNFSHIKLQIPATVTELYLSYQDEACGILPLSWLPNGLVKLDCTIGALEYSDKVKFPETLRSLSLQLHSAIPPSSLFEILPDQLEELVISSELIGGLYIELKDWALLSKLSSLKRICFEMEGGFDREAAQLLPRTLEKLILLGKLKKLQESSVIEILKELPKNLKVLTGILPSTTTLNIAKNLPRNLEGILRGKVEPAAVAYIPDKVTWIEIASNLDVDLISSFPAFLRYLVLPHVSPLIFDRLPSHLTELTIHDSETVLTAAEIKKLPSSLTVLSNRCPVDNWALILEALPPKLSSLSWGPNTHAPLWEDIVPQPMPTQASLLLPRGLKHLSLGYLDFSEGNMAEWILGLPTGLVSLSIDVLQPQKGICTSIGFLTQLDTLTIRTKTTPEGGWAPYLDMASLPRSLAELSLLQNVYTQANTNTSNITDESFFGAPPALNIVTIPTSTITQNGVFSHLPKRARLYFDVAGNPASYSDL
jgi:hypothetical protein